VTSAGAFAAGALPDVVVTVADELELVREVGSDTDPEPDADAAVVGAADELSLDAD
jgi:hypothetical protein